MKVKIKRSDTSGQVKIPSSKSHTIRAIYLASLAKGHSRIKEALISSDTRSAIEVCRSFGATIRSRENTIEIDGLEGHPGIPDDVIDVGNSGTSLRIGLSTAALINGYTVFTGDEQIKNRTLQPLMTALNNLGAQVFSIKDNGKAPVIVKGVAKGGVTELEAISSQYLSSLLINAPLFQNDTEIRLTLLNERPYVDMTLNWLDKQNIKYENDNYRTFHIKGGQAYQAFDQSIPGDFSSASFFLGLGALSDNEVILENLDMNDTQGDKLVIEYLKQMGASVRWDEDRLIIKGGKLKGARIDMNSTPDALPIMAVVACFADGQTELYNVSQARIKETDRIRVMRAELAKLGADIEEKEDGLVIKKSLLKGHSVSGHSDHRVVMALTVAGLMARGETIIDTAEAVNITFPDFFDLIKACHGDITLLD